MRYYTPEVHGNLAAHVDEVLTSSDPTVRQLATAGIVTDAGVYHDVAADPGLWGACDLRLDEGQPAWDVRVSVITQADITMLYGRRLLGLATLPYEPFSLMAPDDHDARRYERAQRLYYNRTEMCKAAFRLWYVVQPHMIRYPDPESIDRP